MESFPWRIHSINRYDQLKVRFHELQLTYNHVLLIEPIICKQFQRYKIAQHEYLFNLVGSMHFHLKQPTPCLQIILLESILKRIIR